MLLKQIAHPKKTMLQLTRVGTSNKILGDFDLDLPEKILKFCWDHTIYFFLKFLREELKIQPFPLQSRSTEKDKLILVQTEE